MVLLLQLLVLVLLLVLLLQLLELVLVLLLPLLNLLHLSLRWSSCQSPSEMTVHGRLPRESCSGRRTPPGREHRPRNARSTKEAQQRTRDWHYYKESKRQETVRGNFEHHLYRRTWGPDEIPTHRLTSRLLKASALRTGEAKIQRLAAHFLRN